MRPVADSELPDPIPADLPFLSPGGRAGIFARFTLPIAAMTALLLSVFLVFPNQSAEFLGLLLAYVVPPAGKETIIPAMVEGAGFSPFLVAIYIAGFDMTVAWFLAWNWDTVTRLPKLGDWIEETMERGHERLQATPLLDRSAFLGLTLFVFFPLQGSGAVVGIILGRMVGLPPQRAWVAIMIGALLAAFTWAYASNLYGDAIQAFGLGRVLQLTVVVISVGVLVWFVARRMRDDGN